MQEQTVSRSSLDDSYSILSSVQIEKNDVLSMDEKLFEFYDYDKAEASDKFVSTDSNKYLFQQSYHLSDVGIRHERIEHSLKQGTVYFMVEQLGILGGIFFVLVRFFDNIIQPC